MSSSEPDDAAHNVEVWTKANAEYTDEHARRGVGARRDRRGASGASPSPSSASLGDVDGLDVVELGCGTAYFSAWLAKRGARPVGVDLTPAQLETARRMQAETGLEFPLVEASRRGRAVARRVRSTSPSRSTARRSGSIRTAGSPRRRGCCVPAAGSSSSATRRSSILCSARTRAGRRSSSCSAAVRHAPLRVARHGRVEFHLPHGELDRRPARERVRGRAARRAPGAGRRRDARRTTTTSRPSGRSKWPAEEIWVGAEARVSVPPAPPLLLASTSPQRPAILEQLRIPFDVVAPDYEEDDPPDADPLERRTHARQGAVGRRRRPARARRRHRGRCSTARCSASRRTRPRPRRMLERARRPDARGRLRPLPAHAGVGGARSTRRRASRSARSRRASSRTTSRAGEWEGRAGGYAIQGLGASLVERSRGRLPERRRPPGRAARPPARGALRGRLRLRLERPCSGVDEPRQRVSRTRQSPARAHRRQRRPDASYASPARRSRSVPYCGASRRRRSCRGDAGRGIGRERRVSEHDRSRPKLSAVEPPQSRGRPTPRVARSRATTRRRRRVEERARDDRGYVSVHAEISRPANERRRGRRPGRRRRERVELARERLRGRRHGGGRIARGRGRRDVPGVVRARRGRRARTDLADARRRERPARARARRAGADALECSR